MLALIGIIKIVARAHGSMFPEPYTALPKIVHVIMGKLNERGRLGGLAVRYTFLLVERRTPYALSDTTRESAIHYQKLLLLQLFQGAIFATKRTKEFHVLGPFHEHPFRVSVQRPWALLATPTNREKVGSILWGFVARPQVIGVVKVLAPTHLHEFVSCSIGSSTPFVFSERTFRVYPLVGRFQICKVGSPQNCLIPVSVILTWNFYTALMYC